MTSPYEVFIQDDNVKFMIGSQKFTIRFDPENEDNITKEMQLEWMRDMLDKALNQLVNK
jgi:hypothetical protein